MQRLNNVNMATVQIFTEDFALMTINNGLLNVDKGKCIRAHVSEAFRARRYI
jgi:hypothetical protein